MLILLAAGRPENQINPVIPPTAAATKQRILPTERSAGILISLMLPESSRHQGWCPHGIEQESFDGDSLPHSQRSGSRTIHNTHFGEHDNVDGSDGRRRASEERRETCQRKCRIAHADAPHLAADL